MKRYPWNSRRHKLKRAVERALTNFIGRPVYLDHYSPLYVFMVMADSGYDWSSGEPEFTPSIVTRIGNFGVRKIEIAQALYATVTGEWQGHNWMGIERWQRPLYRAKAVVCLLFGRHFVSTESERYFEGIDIAFWNHQEYSTPDGRGGSCDELSVGPGLRDWRVDIVHESWP